MSLSTEQIDSIIEGLGLEKEFFVYQMNFTEKVSEDSRKARFYKEEILPNHVDLDDMRKIALMQHLEDNFDIADYDLGTSYNVTTEEEDKQALEALLVDHLNNVVLPNIPWEYHDYFDKEKFIDDRKEDKSGWLEDSWEETIGSETFYIYKL